LLLAPLLLYQDTKRTSLVLLGVLQRVVWRIVFKTSCVSMLCSGYVSGLLCAVLLTNRHADVAMQMSIEKAADYCRRRTTFLQQQQQGVQKVRRETCAAYDSVLIHVPALRTSVGLAAGAFVR
jgi:hypothetical protein